jgi:hypothetical protein
MEKDLLAAITGAVAAYIQQEDMPKAAFESRMSAWRLFGLLQLMGARTNSKVVKLPSRRSTWRFSGLQKSMRARAMWGIKYTG